MRTMTNARHGDATQTTLTTPASPGEQLSLALALTPHRATVPTARQLPAQLRLDARTRQVGRAGIAEIRRILAEGASTSKAA
jgi:hypothetical protein